jgi:hypothetical protein
MSPLPQYGVAIGTLVSFTRDPPHNFGSWYHGHVTLQTGATTWQSALDVDAPVAVGVSYRLVTGLTTNDLGPVAALPDGYHALTHDGLSGALDYLRSRALQNSWVISWLRSMTVRSRPAPGWKPPPANIGQPGGPDPASFPRAPFEPDPIDSLLERLLRVRLNVPLKWLTQVPHVRWRSFPWIASNGDNALDALSPHLQAASRIYVYGERYEDGTNGVHDVHMNQGDPFGSQWYATNGTWQDGGVACQHADGSVVVWQVRFNTQSLHTDDQGHPA